MLCRNTVAGIASRASEFYATGIPLIAIAPGTPAMARDFAKQYNFPGELYTDSRKLVHVTFKCKRGLKYVSGSQSLGKGRMAMMYGHKQSVKDLLMLDPQKDPLQIGGTFLLSPTKGFIYNHVERVS